MARAAEWLTYEEIAERLKNKVASARRLARRRKDWPRKIGPDGRSVMAVPTSYFSERPKSFPRGLSTAALRQDMDRLNHAIDNAQVHAKALAQALTER
jgi:hypothetical protein